MKTNLNLPAPGTWLNFQDALFCARTLGMQSQGNKQISSDGEKPFLVIHGPSREAKHLLACSPLNQIRLTAALSAVCEREFKKELSRSLPKEVWLPPMDLGRELTRKALQT